MGDDPPYLMVGTEVSAKYKGAFCEAKIRKVVRVVKCRVTFKGLGSATLPDDHIKGDLRVGSVVEAKHPDKNQFIEATINKIQDSSQYTVVFDDGDITTLRRSALCLKSGRHFNESETLDQLPLTHPEHFSNPVMGGRRGVRRRAANNDDNDNDSSDEEDIPAKKGRKKTNREAHMGKVVCVESTDKKKNSKDSWFPALVVCPAAQDTVKIRTKDEYLVRSFRDGRYYTVPKKETTFFTKESSSKAEHSSNVLRTACEKAVQFMEKDELPAHWDREALFGHGNVEVSDEALSESEMSEDDPRESEDKDRFVAQLYKFMDDRGTPISKVPSVSGKDLDLHKLYNVVMSKGGYNKVCNSGQWKPVTIKMGYGASPAAVTVNILKTTYKKFLHNFEDFYRKLGPLDSLGASSSGSKSRSNRSLFRERHASTKESKKEEIKDDEDKKSVASTQGTSSSIAGESPEEMDAETESVYSEKLDAERPEEPRRSRSRLDSRGKKDLDDVLSEKPKGKRTSKKKDAERDKERENSRTPVSASPSPAPSNKRGGGGGGGSGGSNGGGGARSKKKKESQNEVDEDKSEPEEFPDHIDKNVKIQIGDKVQVYYGPKSKGNVTYKAKVIEVNESETTQRYLVHYTGWNNRYDEWIERYRIASLSTQKDPGKGSNEDASEADSNGATAAKQSTKAPKKKGRPSAGQNAKKSGGGGGSGSGGSARKRLTSESDKTKKARVRKKSEQDNFPPSGSGSDADSSDSEDKQMPMASTPSSISSTSSSTAKIKATTPKADQVNEDDENSCASSSGSGALSKKSEVNSGTASPSPSTPPQRDTPMQVSGSIDLMQIRSEMKGLDKIVKMSQASSVVTAPTVTATVARSSSPVPAASVCVPQTEVKLDVYEFQDDANDTPKLKIFTPTRSPERKEEQSLKVVEEEKLILRAVVASAATTSDSDSQSSSRPLTPVKSAAAINPSTSVHESSGKKESKKKKEIKEEDSPAYSPIKVPSSKSLGGSKEPLKFTPSPVVTTGVVGFGSTSKITVPTLQPSIAVENKSTLRMQTPILHTPQQPIRQRAVLSSYPPPLIPSAAPKPVVSPAPLSTTVSPPMPSLTQRPPIVAATPNTLTPAPQLHPQQLQHVRPITPLRIPSPPFVSSSPISIPPAPTLQPAAALKPAEPQNNKPFMSRQQEVFPHLAQQASKPASPPVVPKTSMAPISITPLPTSYSPAGSLSSSSANLPIFSSPTIMGKDIVATKPPLPLGVSPTGSAFVPTAVPKKSPVKRKQPGKDRSTPKSPPNLIVPSAARMDQSHLPPKKKAKKVITKNIIDLFSSGGHEQQQQQQLQQQQQAAQQQQPVKEGIGAESPTKKARKPAKKRIIPPPDSPVGPPSTGYPILDKDNRSPGKSPPKTIKKKPKILDLSGPPLLVPAKISAPPSQPPIKVSPPTTFLTATASVNPISFTPVPGTAPIALITHTPTTTTTPPSFPTTEIPKPTPTYGKPPPPELHLGMSKMDSTTKMQTTPAKPIATLGHFSVLKTPEKKSYAPKMTPAGLARITTCIDNVAKLPEQNPVTVRPSPAAPPPPPPPSQVKVTLPTTTLAATTTTTYVKIPNKFDPTPIVIATMTGQPSAVPKPITVIPVRTFSSTPTLVPRSGPEPVESIVRASPGPSLVVTMDPRSDPRIKPLVVVPVPKESPPGTLLTASSIPVIKIPEIKDEKLAGDAVPAHDEADENPAPVCLVVKEEIVPPQLTVVDSKKEVLPKEEVTVDRLNDEEDVKPTDLSVSRNSTPVLAAAAVAAVTGEPEKLVDEEVKEEKTKEEDESCNSLLCEEIIPGSPPPGTDSSLFGVDDENSMPATGMTKDSRPVSPKPPPVKAEPVFPGSSESWKERDVREEDGSGFSRSKSPKSGPTEVNFPRKTSSGLRKQEAEDRALSSSNSSSSSSNNSRGNNNQERPPPHVPYNNSNSNNNSSNHQQNLQHVIDNTPPTTPESSSVSSGSPRIEGGRVSPTNDHPSSSKSKDSSDVDSNDKLTEMNEEGSSSDAGRKYVKDSASSPQKKRHAESRNSGGNVSPLAKRRRVQRRKSPDEIRSYGYRGRGSGGGRKGNEKDVDHGKIQPPPPPVNLTRPPVSKKFNLIPELDEQMDSESRIQVLQQALQTIKEKYQEVKSELSSEERRLKRFKRRLKEREKEKKVTKST